MKAKQIKEKPRSKIETARRIRIVQEWVLQDYATADIIQQACASFEVTQRQAYRYLWAAYQFFKEKSAGSINTKINYYLSRKKKLLRDMDPNERRTAAGVAAANKVLDSMAKLEGITLDTVKLIGDPKQPIHTQNTTTQYTTPKIDYENLPTEVLVSLLETGGRYAK